MEQIWVYDTTLRDGTQGEDVNFSAEEKLRVAKRLDEMGIHFIEGGWPGANPRDDRFFELARSVVFQNSTLVAFGCTRKPGIAASKDATLKAIAECGVKAACIFGKSWDLHVETVMENTREENLAMIRDSVSHLARRGMAVYYDAEHFFDGYKSDADYALATIIEAAEGGARCITLCDTNGGTLPHEVEQIVKVVKATVKTDIGIHTHNDCGLAVANTIAGVRAGAKMVQGTINGYGERCGNADLTSIMPILQIKMGYRCVPDENLAGLRRLSRFVSEAANTIPRKNRPFVGESAFAHKGGVHVSAVMKAPKAYEHINPELVGNKRRVLVSDLAGKSNVEYKAWELGIDLNEGANGSDVKKIVTDIKRMENQGYQFDAAEGSFELFLKRKVGQFVPRFELLSFLVTIRKEKDRPCFAEATVKLSVDGQERFTAAEGRGPVGALDNAIRRALWKFYPKALDTMRLKDFKVRVIDGRDGTAAKVKVFIESGSHEQTWKTIGVSEDIIEASWQALADSFHYLLMKSPQEQQQEDCNI